jgi:hypothetical protein
MLFVCCLPVLFISGCATAPNPNPIPLTEKDEYFNSAGIVIKRPSGDNWYWYTPQNNVLAFSKHPDSDTHTFIIPVYTINFRKQFSDQNSFLEYVKKEKEKDTNPKRFKNVKFDLKLDNKYGDYSVKYLMEAEDHGVRIDNGKIQVIRVVGYFFLHPNEPKLAYDISYSERGSLDEMNADLVAIGEEFINNNVTLRSPSNRKR